MIFVHLHHMVTNFGIGHVVMWSCDSDIAAMCPRYVHFLGIRELFLQELRLVPGRRKDTYQCIYSYQKYWTRHAKHVTFSTCTKQMLLHKCIL